MAFHLSRSSTLTLAALLTLSACAGTKEASMDTAPAPIAEASKDEAPPAAPEGPHSFKVDIQGSGPHLILIPGLSNGGETLSGIAEAFEDRFTVHTLTLPGFAGTPPLPGERFLPVVKSDLIDYIEGLGSAALMGHSLGATLSFWVASESPSSVNAVVAIDGLPYLAELMTPGITPEAALAGATAMKAQMAGLDDATFCAQTQYALRTMITDPGDQATVGVLACQSTPRAAAQAMFELMTTDLRPKVGNITAPILLLGAGAFAPNEEAKAGLHARYESQIAAAPNHKVVIVDGARHYIFLDQPDAFFAETEAFLGEVL